MLPNYTTISHLAFGQKNPADVLSELEIMQGGSTSEFGGNLPMNRYATARILVGLLGDRASWWCNSFIRCKTGKP